MASNGVVSPATVTASLASPSNDAGAASPALLQLPQTGDRDPFGDASDAFFETSPFPSNDAAPVPSSNCGHAEENGFGFPSVPTPTDAQTYFPSFSSFPTPTDADTNLPEVDSSDAFRIPFADSLGDPVTLVIVKKEEEEAASFDPSETSEVTNLTCGSAATTKD